MTAHNSRHHAGPTVLLLGLLTASLGCGSEPAYVEPPPPQVTVAVPTSQAVTDYLDVTGTVEAIETVEIRARVEGFLEKVEFQEGQLVEEGALLYIIDPREFEAKHSQAEAAERTAQAALALAQATLQRREKAALAGGVSEIDVLQSRAQRDVASAELQSARAEVRRADLDLSYTQIRAPIRGRVGDNRVDVGNLVGNGESTLLTTILRYDPIHVYFTINEREVLRISRANQGQAAADNRVASVEGQRIEAARSIDEGYPLEGVLDLVDQGVDRETGTLLLRAVFPNPEPVKLFPGLFIRARMPLRERDDVLLVSERALGSDQSGRYVLVVGDDDIVQYRSVKIGVAVGGLRVIEEGISADDRVITKGILYARPGAKVSPQAEAAKAREEASG